MTETITFRPARPDDANTVGLIARQSRTYFLPFLPDLHSLEGDQKFYRNRVFPECEVWVVDVNGTPVGFCAFKKDWVEHLYLLPGHVGQSYGPTLLDKAKTRFPFLQLWVFQQNTRAISFYERHGFRRVRETDGASNEEKVPDALYAWHKQS